MFFFPQQERSSNFKAPPPEYVSDAPPGYEEVHASEWRARQGKLLTKGVADCIALIALNTLDRTTLIGHLFPEDFDTDLKFIDNAVDTISLLGPSNATKVALAGGRSGIHEGAHFKRREYIAGRVARIAVQHGIPETSISVLWLEDPPDQYDQWVDVFADPEAGKITVIETLTEARLDGQAIIRATTI